MRHEVINLDFPGQPQNYPACINLVVTGGGSSSPQGVVGTDLYTGQEPGLNFDIFNMKTADYPCPGPPVNAGGSQGESYTGDDNAAETSPETPSAPQTQPSPAASPSPATEPSPPAAPSPVTEPSSPAAPSARATEESAPVEGSDDEESECISPNLTPRAWTA